MTPARPANRTGRQLSSAEFSLLASVGGIRGLLESVLPVAVFSLVYGLDPDLRRAIVAALVPAVLLAIWRLLRREPLTQAVSGLIAIGIGAWIATRTHRAENFFLPSILKNAGLAAGYALSALVRWPLIGILVGGVTGDLTGWRSDPARLRAFSRVTWIWVAMFLLRIAVQTPLWLTHRVALLGTVNIVLGLPLFAVTIWLSWLVLRPHLRDPEAGPPEAARPAAQVPGPSLGPDLGPVSGSVSGPVDRR